MRGQVTDPDVTRPVRLAVVNDFEIVVVGIAKMFANEPRIDVLELDHRREVVAEVDIVLADMFAAVPGDGIDLEELISAGGPQVVVYTWNTHRAAVARALALGASGYLSKGLGALELVEALEAIHSGETVVSPVVDLPDAQIEGDWPGRIFGLTQREAEVLAFIAKGQSNLEIAEALSLSINTIKTYIRSAYAKTGVTRRSQAVNWALRHGFAPEAGRETPTTSHRPRGSTGLGYRARGND